MFNQFFLSSTRYRFCCAVILFMAFSCFGLLTSVRAQEAANDPVTAVEVGNVIVYRDAVTTGSVTITCYDTKGNPVPNASVSISISSPGSVSPTSGTTDNNGNVVVTVKSTDFTAEGQDEVATVTATSQGVSGTGTVIFKGPLQIVNEGVDATSKTTMCNIGEQQYLQVYTLSGVTITNAYWTASGATPISNWSPGPAGGASVETYFPGSDGSQPQVSLYLTTTGSDTVTLSATDSAASASATTNFNVSKPSDFAFTAGQQGAVAGNIAVGLGGHSIDKSNPVAGIGFSGSGGTGGVLTFAQILTANTVTYTDDAGKHPPTSTPNLPGLDNTFPYPSSSPGATNDSPSHIYSYSGIDTHITEIYVTNWAATMYLMWTSNKTSSIPIPVESIAWNWNADATFDASTGNSLSIHGSLPPRHISGTTVNNGALNWTNTIINSH